MPRMGRGRRGRGGMGSGPLIGGQDIAKDVGISTRREQNTMRNVGEMASMGMDVSGLFGPRKFNAAQNGASPDPNKSIKSLKKY